MDEPSAPSLESLMNALGQEDSIMEMDAIRQVARVAQLGGKPEHVVETLAGAYRGLAAMCNAVAEWTHALDDLGDDDEVARVAEQRVADLAEARFDSRRAGSVLRREQAAPTWVEFMVRHAQWRQLVYRLSDTNKDCLLLNFAIQRISEAGYHAEIGGLATAAAYFSVFNRVLGEHIRAVLDADEKQFAELLPSLIKVCCDGLHTYAYTQSLLRSVVADISGDAAAPLRRMAEALETGAAEQHRGRMARRVSMLLDGAGGNLDAEADGDADEDLQGVNKASRDILDALASMLRDGELNPGDMMRVHSALRAANTTSAKSALPVFALRRIEFLNLLMRELFTPERAKRLQTQYKQRYTYVLAFVASGDADADELTRVCARLRDIHEICARNSLSGALMDEAPRLLAGMETPVCAMAILQYVEANFGDEHYFIAAYDTRCFQLHLALVRLVFAQHALMRARACRLLFAAIDTRPQLDALVVLEMQRELLDCALHLLLCGHLDVLDQIHSRQANIDASLIRHFLLRLFESVCAPYADEFVDRVAAVVSQADAARTAELDRAIATFWRDTGRDTKNGE